MVTNSKTWMAVTVLGLTFVRSAPVQAQTGTLVADCFTRSDYASRQESAQRQTGKHVASLLSADDEVDDDEPANENVPLPPGRLTTLPNKIRQPARASKQEVMPGQNPPVSNTQVIVNQAPVNSWAPVGCGFDRGPLWSSTAAEGRLRGQADWLRGAGLYEWMHSEAIKNIATARQNMMIAESERRDENTARARERAETELARQEYRRETRTLAQRAVSATAPERPLFHTETGAILWPTALKANEFKVMTTELEEMLMECDVQVAPEDTEKHDRRFQALTQSLLTELKRHIGSIKSNDYVEAKQFVVSLVDACSPRPTR